jgi:hypothetical protein
VEPNAGDDNVRERGERVAQPGRCVVVLRSLQPVTDSEVRNDHRDGELGLKCMEGFDIRS